MHNRKIDDSTLVELFQKGYSDEEIADVFQVQRGTVRIKRCKLGLRRNYYPSKRKHELIEECWQLYRGGKDWSEIAQLVNLKDTLGEHGGYYKEDKARYYVGLKLMELCRRNSKCPTKAMLPETEIKWEKI